MHFEACNAFGASDGVIYSRISHEVASFRAAANISSSVRFRAEGVLVRVGSFGAIALSIAGCRDKAAELRSMVS